MMLAELSSVQNMPMARPPGNVISRRQKCMPRGGAPSSVYNYAAAAGGGVLGGGWRRRSRDGEHAGVTHIIWQVREVLHHAPGRSAGQPLEDHGGKARGLHEKVPVRDRWHNGQPARAPVHFTSTYHTVTWVLPLRPTRVSCPNQPSSWHLHPLEFARALGTSCEALVHAPFGRRRRRRWPSRCCQAELRACYVSLAAIASQFYRHHCNVRASLAVLPWRLPRSAWDADLAPNLPELLRVVEGCRVHVGQGTGRGGGHVATAASGRRR